VAGPPRIDVAGPPVFCDGDIAVQLDLGVFLEFIGERVKLGLCGDFYDIHDLFLLL
jgi:hypothetical protein